MLGVVCLRYVHTVCEKSIVLVVWHPNISSDHWLAKRVSTRWLSLKNNFTEGDWASYSCSHKKTHESLSAWRLSLHFCMFFSFYVLYRVTCLAYTCYSLFNLILFHGTMVWGFPLCCTLLKIWTPTNWVALVAQFVEYSPKLQSVMSSNPTVVHPWSRSLATFLDSALSLLSCKNWIYQACS